MGTFSVECRVENVIERRKGAAVPRILVDAGSEYTWVSTKILEKIGVVEEKKDLEFVMANGQRVTRSVGFAIIRIGKAFTVDEVVFAERGDLLLLGARSLDSRRAQSRGTQPDRRFAAQAIGCGRPAARRVSIRSSAWSCRSGERLPKPSSFDGDLAALAVSGIA